MKRSILIPSILGIISAIAGCGGDVTPAPSDAGASDASADHAAAFVGSWSPTSGTVTISCAGMAPTTTAVTAPDVFARGTSSDLVLANDCGLRFAAGAQIATILPGQSCADAASGLTLVPSAWSFATSDGVTATESSAGAVNGARDAAGAPLACTYTENASYVKGAK